MAVPAGSDRLSAAKLDSPQFHTRTRYHEREYCTILVPNDEHLHPHFEDPSGQYTDAIPEREFSFLLPAIILSVSQRPAWGFMNPGSSTSRSRNTFTGLLASNFVLWIGYRSTSVEHPPSYFDSDRHFRFGPSPPLPSLGRWYGRLLYTWTDLVYL